MNISDHGELDFLTPALTAEEKTAASGFLNVIHERRSQLNARDRDREIRANERAIADFNFQRFMP
jgi:hypothetical protein